MAEFDSTHPVDVTKPQEFKRRRRRRRRFRTLRKLARRLNKVNWLLMITAGVGMILAVLIGGLVLTVQAQGQVEKSWNGLERVLDDINTKSGTELTLSDFDLLQLSVSDFKRSLAIAKTRTAFLRPLDFLSSDLQTSLQTLDAAQELSLAADEVLRGLEPALFYLAEGEEDESVTPALSSGHRIVELLTLGRNSFISANQHLISAQAVIDTMPLENVSSTVFVTVDQLTSFHSMLDDYNQLLIESPELFTTMLGLQENKTYLVLSQNNDELRPSGGYISTYGWIEVRKGRIADYFYGETTTTTPNPPEGVELAYEVPDWWIQYANPVYAAWDASWFADYPTTAELATWYFDNGGNLSKPVDGAIAIDMIGFQMILEGLESVTVNEYSETVTPENFRNVVYQIRSEGEHNEFLAALYYQIMTDWQNTDQEESAALRRVVLQALQEKHIMVYFADERLNAAMDMLNWSGKQEEAVDNDYVMVADANINGSKHNSSVLRETTYDVTIQDDGSLESRLTIAYDYSARVAENDPAIQPAHYIDIDYYGTHQVFVPLGSQLLDTNDLQFAPDIVANPTNTEFVSTFTIAYDDNERFQYVYSTPVLVEQIGNYRRYRLQLQKQPGTPSEIVSVQVMLPADAATVNVSPEPVASYDLQQPILEFRIELTHDMWIEIIYTE